MFRAPRGYREGCESNEDSGVRSNTAEERLLSSAGWKGKSAPFFSGPRYGEIRGGTGRYAEVRGEIRGEIPLLGWLAGVPLPLARTHLARTGHASLLHRVLLRVAAFCRQARHALWSLLSDGSNRSKRQCSSSSGE